jgi:hypothetical protein
MQDNVAVVEANRVAAAAAQRNRPFSAWDLISCIVSSN